MVRGAPTSSPPLAARAAFPTASLATAVLSAAGVPGPGASPSLARDLFLVLVAADGCAGAAAAALGAQAVRSTDAVDVDVEQARKNEHRGDEEDDG